MFLVFEYCEHDLSLLLRSQLNHRHNRHPFKESEIKCIMLSVLRALECMHRQNLLHRDIKLSNILYDRYGCVKLADFGLAREYEDVHTMTPQVVTLWYRAPEILFGSTKYTSAVDMWACGCIFAELLLLEPLVPGSSDIDQLKQIFKVSQDIKRVG